MRIVSQRRTGRPELDVFPGDGYYLRAISVKFHPLKLTYSRISLPDLGEYPNAVSEIHAQFQ